MERAGKKVTVHMEERKKEIGYKMSRGRCKDIER